MKYSTFDIFIVCVGYSDYLKLCLHYWMYMDYDNTNYRIIIITSKEDKETIKLCQEFIDKGLNLAVILYLKENYHYKGNLLKYGLKQVGNLSDYIIFSDSDIIFFSDLLIKLNCHFSENNDYLISSYREDIAPESLSSLYAYYNNKKHTWVWENLNRKILYPSPFMGWFLSFSSKYVNNIDFIEKHHGYDVIDWKIYGQLKNMNLKENIIYLKNSPLHIFHGEKGSNWKGVNLE